MRKGFNGILTQQFLLFALTTQSYVFSVRSLIVGRDFALIILSLVIAQLFGAFLAHVLYKMMRTKVNIEVLTCFTAIGFAIASSLLLMIDRNGILILGDLLVFRTILFFCYLSYSMFLYFGFVSIMNLKEILDSESYYDLVRVSYAGLFVGIIYNLVLRTAMLSLNPYLLNLLSILIVAVAVGRYYLIKNHGKSEDLDSNSNELRLIPTDEDKPMKQTLLQNIIIFSIVWSLFMLPINNPELMSYMSNMSHEWIQYIFVLTSILGILIGVKAVMMKYLRKDVYVSLQSYLPVLTLLTIGLFGFYLFYPPSQWIYLINYVVSILIFALVASISFFEIFSSIKKSQIGYFVFLIFFIHLLQVSIRLLMIERHMPYIWSILLIIMGVLQYLNYRSQYQKKNEESQRSLESNNIIEEKENGCD